VSASPTRSGAFLVDSIAPGSYKVDVDHPILDTLGIMLSTAPMQFVRTR
jgi:hypothetical protein